MEGPRKKKTNGRWWSEPVVDPNEEETKPRSGSILSILEADSRVVPRRLRDLLPPCVDLFYFSNGGGTKIHGALARELPPGGGPFHVGGSRVPGPNTFLIEMFIGGTARNSLHVPNRWRGRDLLLGTGKLAIKKECLRGSWWIFLYFFFSFLLFFSVIILEEQEKEQFFFLLGGTSLIGSR